MIFVLITITLLMAALFSGSEAAFFATNRVRIGLEAQNHSVSGRVLMTFYKQPEQFITTLLIGNIICIIIFGITTARLISEYSGIYALAKPITILIQIFVVTLFTLICTDFIPKTIFRIKPYTTLRTCALPLYIIYILLYPLAYISRGISKGLLHISGHQHLAEKYNSTISKSDLDQFIQQSIEGIDNNTHIEAEVKILQKALKFSQRSTRDCMIPRTEIAGIEVDNISKDELITLFTESGYSKILVYNKSLDHIVGYIHSSDLFRKAGEPHKLIRPITQVPGSMPAQKLMHILMRQKRSIAVVIDEHGYTAGIASLEDIVEEIFGEIEDEHDITRYSMRKSDNGYYEFSRRTEIEKINKIFNLDIPESNEYKTIIGYILYHHRTLPRQGECIEIGNRTYEITSQKGEKADLIRVHEHTYKKEKLKKSPQNT